jgi:hypothetical protein
VTFEKMYKVLFRVHLTLFSHILAIRCESLVSSLEGKRLPQDMSTSMEVLGGHCRGSLPLYACQTP